METFEQYMDRQCKIDQMADYRVKDCSSCGKTLPCPSKEVPKNSKKRLPPEFINATLCRNWQPDF